MSNNKDSSTDRGTRLLLRNKNSAMLARESVINRLKAIFDLSTRLSSSPELIAGFLIAIEELDSLWESFLLKNHDVLNALLDLDSSSEFDTKLESEIRNYYTIAMVAPDKYKPRVVQQFGGQSHVADPANLTRSHGSNIVSSMSGSRLL